ncbi:TPA: hypothetical protein ACN35K_003046 [Vibrio parahaemolyticus]
MHPLQNGSQATVRPAKKPTVGLAGWFTESGDNNVPSYPGADWFNNVIAEFQNALTEQGVLFDPNKDDHLSQMFTKGKKVSNVSTMLATNFKDGDTCSTGGTSWTITTDSNGLELDNGLFAIPASSIYFDDFDGDDKAVEIRTVIDLIERLGYPIKITGSGKLSLLKSSILVDGFSCAFAIRKANLVHIDTAMISFRVDINTPSMAGLDCVLAVAPTTSDYSSYVFWSGLRIEGGNWPLISQRPKNIVKADFFTLRYAYLCDCRFRFSREHNVVMSAFVVLGNKVRGSFAGPTHNNFNFVVSDLAGDSAARTGYLLNGCTGDYAGLHNFSFSGANGHTYCHLNNCHGDFAGRDEAGNTIEGNIDEASAYHFENIRVVTATALGVEKSTRLLTGVNCRTLDVNGIYGVLCGDTEGSSIESAMEFEGFCENVSISKFENRDPVSGFDYKLGVTNPDVYHTNCFTLDKSIKPDTDVIVRGDYSRTDSTQFISPYDTYNSGIRKGAGSALVTGKKLLGNTRSEWFAQSSMSAEETFHFETAASSVTKQLLELTAPSATALMGFSIEIEVTGLNGTSAFLPTRYGFSAVSSASSKSVSAPNTIIEGYNYPSPPSVAWNGNFLEVTVPTTYAAVYVRVLAHGRKSSGTQAFEWLS